MIHERQTMKDSSLIWVYPPNKWKSGSSRTFIYGYSSPIAKLFVSTDEYRTPQQVNVCPNGNFAMVINLPGVENIVKLIQISGKKKTTLKRRICIRKDLPLTSDFKSQPTGYRSQVAGHRSQFSIVIDPGHGGKEHGTHSPKGIPEKVFNLQIAKLLYKKLTTKKHARKIKVYLTRTKDKYVSLEDRVAFAKKKKCNLLISIHHNALPDGEDPLKHMGVGIYYTHNFVKPLALKLLSSISKESKLKRYGIFKRNFALTRVDFCKAVLIECGFLIHPIEAEIVTNSKTQEKIVQGIVIGLLSEVIHKD